MVNLDELPLPEHAAALDTALEALQAELRGETPEPGEDAGPGEDADPGPEHRDSRESGNAAAA